MNYHAVLGEKGAPNTDGFGADPSTRPIRITDGEGKTIYAKRTSDTTQAADNHIRNAGFQRVSDWVDGGAELIPIPQEAVNKRRMKAAAIVGVVVAGLAGCSIWALNYDASDKATADGPPSDPLDQMLISFNGSPSKSDIQEALDDAMNATDLPITTENYSRAGSVLIAFRKEHGIDEMDILECIPTAVEDPRLPEVTFPNVAAVCVTDLVQGVRS